MSVDCRRVFCLRYSSLALFLSSKLRHCEKRTKYQFPSRIMLLLVPTLPEQYPLQICQSLMACVIWIHVYLAFYLLYSLSILYHSFIFILAGTIKRLATTIHLDRFSHWLFLVRMPAIRLVPIFVRVTSDSSRTSFSIFPHSQLSFHPTIIHTTNWLNTIQQRAERRCLRFSKD